MEVSKKYLGLTTDRPLYHYTSQEGLMGILRDGWIWATHILHLNDYSEYVHALEITKSIAESRIKTAEGGHRVYYSGVLAATSALIAARPTETYVAAFCEEKDAMTLWRSYCPENGGYAFGFDWRKNTDDRIVLGKCIYNDDDKRSVLEEQLDGCEVMDAQKVRDAFAARNDPIDDGTSDEHARALGFSAELNFAAAFFKHSSFEDEREWRAVLHQRTDWSVKELFRPGRTQLIRYSTISLVEGEVLPVQDIVVGPTPYPEPAALAVRRYVRALNKEENRHFRIEYGDVIRSKAPFRVV